LNYHKNIQSTVITADDDDDHVWRWAPPAGPPC